MYIKQVVHPAAKFTFSFKKILKKLGTDFGMKIQTFTTEFEFLNQKLIFATVCIISKKSLFLPFIFLFLDALLISFLCVKNLGLNIQIITRERKEFRFSKASFYSTSIRIEGIFSTSVFFFVASVVR